jgi:hypothetical protein
MQYGNIRYPPVPKKKHVHGMIHQPLKQEVEERSKD